MTESEALQHICKIIFPALNLVPTPPPGFVVDMVRHLKENPETTNEIGSRAAELSRRLAIEAEQT